MKALELENRLVRFSVMCLKLVKEVKQVEESKHLCSHLIRSGTSEALNYAEARDGESLRDFIHKNENRPKRIEGSIRMSKNLAGS